LTVCGMPMSSCSVSGHRDPPTKLRIKSVVRPHDERAGVVHPEGEVPLDG
jgi:hypothetical protein